MNFRPQVIERLLEIEKPIMLKARDVGARCIVEDVRLTNVFKVLFFDGPPETLADQFYEDTCERTEKNC